MKTGIIKYGMVFKVSLIAFVMVIAFTNVVLALPQTPSNWAAEEISKESEVELLSEKTELEYKSNITREEFSELVVNLYEGLSGKECVLEGENPFIDTKSEKVRIANSLGLVKGIGKGKFAPDNGITRQEISVILYRLLKITKPEYDYSYLYNYIFVDDDNISTWAREAVGYLYGIGVINGVGNNYFNPLGFTTKEEAIVLAKRIYDKGSNENLVVSRSGTSRRENVLKAKLAEAIAPEMGKPYKWGGNGPNSYDCSGFTKVVFAKIGISIPRVSRDQAKAGTYVAKANLTYGDLVFFASNGKTVNHVGIYVGDGNFVHAPKTGDVIKISTLATGHYAGTYFTARRVIR